MTPDIDLRKNVQDEEGTSYYVVESSKNDSTATEGSENSPQVVDTDSGRKVAGPFGDPEYAGRVMGRVDWPNEDALAVQQEKRDDD